MPGEGPSEALIPTWAAHLVASVARIEERTNSIPQIVGEIEKLRATMVPQSEHQALQAKVDKLWDDVQVNLPPFLELLPEHKVLMKERSEMRGSLNTLKAMVAGLGLVVALLGLWVAAHNAGIHLST